MSRAFVREDGPDMAPLPDLPVSPHPNWVTANGLAQLQRRLTATQDWLAQLRARPDRLDRLPEAAAERDIRYLEARLKSALPVTPTSVGEVGFGHSILVTDEHGAESRYRIVGEDEADATLGLIAPTAPLARALMGAKVGDTVVWVRPSGRMALDVAEITP